eukprot:scaffold64915_cov45-Attheya_sp.AAC.1
MVRQRLLFIHVHWTRKKTIAFGLRDRCLSYGGICGICWRGLHAVLRHPIWVHLHSGVVGINLGACARGPRAAESNEFQEVGLDDLPFGGKKSIQKVLPTYAGLCMLECCLETGMIAR